MIRNCPDCDSRPIQSSRGHHSVIFHWWVYCGECGLSGPDRGSEEEADIAWNAMALGRKIAEALESGGKIPPEAQQVLRDHFWELL